MQMAREEPYQVISNVSSDSKETMGSGDLAEKREENTNASLSGPNKMRRLIGVSLW